ncbi:MAG: hypothetical protein C4526_05310 [Nitrospiraceae bacterium]|nr:MAG: hypothetical protein C4526_05310 [Nitrospiraceae bacterium]
MEKRTFTDASIVAYLQASNRPFKIIPQKNQSGQIEFLVEGPDIETALTELYSNVPIGVLDFIRCLKGLRSSIFALKGDRK